MILKKEFQIKELNKNEYIVEEKTFLFGIYFIYGYYGLDGLGGDIPFTVFTNAVSVREELKRKSEIQLEKDENIILWLLFLIGVIFLIT